MTKFKYLFLIFILGIIDAITWRIVGHYSSNAVNAALLGIVTLSGIVGYGIAIVEREGFEDE